jgi:type II secretory pathway pseudopilin PulG
MNFKIKNKKSLGFTIVEVIFACAIISVSTIVLMQVAQKGVQLSNLALKKSQASLLLEEGAEAMKSIRDGSWTTIANLSLDTEYHLFFNTSTKTWGLNVSTTNLSGCIPSYPIDSIFNRTIVVSSVGRDANDDILTSGGTTDVKTKKITVTVSWPSTGGVNSKSLSFYMSDIFN